ncbi:MAG: 2-dehydro-3-deoxygalactonokinase [Burkholderiales bacterium]|jgi:2-dehydro-3-deoxygalactonokinase|nr:2-dehydro-3-deoxygalactonokinase [Burkholderiales bacterium]
MNPCALIALDWGTTRARAYRIDPGGRILDSRVDDLGVQKLGRVRFAEALDRLIAPWRDDPVPRIACGMIGSRQGWREAPYVNCPASLARLSGELVETDGGEIAIVPGLATRDASGVPDVMRGEETQLLGAVAPDAPRRLVVLPGTHSKWALVERGVVLDFATFMTGELFDAMIGHTILGRLATASADPDGEAFARGVERGLGPGPTMHDVFGARTLALTGELAAGGIREWLSGFVIGREVRSGRVWAQQAGDDASRVLIVGGEALAGRYAKALALAGAAGERGPADAAAVGLYRMARAAGRVKEVFA